MQNNSNNNDKQSSYANTENTVYFENLKLSERMRLRREFNGINMSIIWFVIYFAAIALLVTGFIIFMLYTLSFSKQRWQFLGLFMLLFGGFVLQTMLQMMAAKQNNLFKMLKSKRKIIMYVVSAGLIAFAGIFTIIFIITPITWIYWTSLGFMVLYFFVHVLPYAVCTAKNKDGKKLTIKHQAQVEQDKFFSWLKTEKNIFSKIHTVNNVADSAYVFTDSFTANNPDDVFLHGNSADNSKTNSANNSSDTPVDK